MRLTFIDVHSLNGLYGMIYLHIYECRPHVVLTNHFVSTFWEFRAMYSTTIDVGMLTCCSYKKLSQLIHHSYTVVPVFSGHPSFPAKVSLHCRCPLIRGVQIYNKTWREFWQTCQHYHDYVHVQIHYRVLLYIHLVPRLQCIENENTIYMYVVNQNKSF